MPDHKEMYYTLLRAGERAVNILPKAQRACEELYLESPRPGLTLSPPVKEKEYLGRQKQTARSRKPRATVFLEGSAFPLACFHFLHRSAHRGDDKGGKGAVPVADKRLHPLDQIIGEPDRLIGSGRDRRNMKRHRTYTSQYICFAKRTWFCASNLHCICIAHLIQCV